MQTLRQRNAPQRRNIGQTLILFLLFFVALILFVGLGIDLGFAYITKAQLSKAVDAACLAGVSNYNSKNTTPATDIATATFYANYATNGLSGRSSTKVVPSVTFPKDANNDTTVKVSASDTIKTYFIGLFPTWKTLTVGDTAQATRSPLYMTLVLDHSYSMNPNCFGGGGICSYGGLYLPNAVDNFINIFDESIDHVAVVAFGTCVTNLVPMSTPFIKPVNNALTYLNNGNWQGYTFSHGGLTNALAINNAVNAPAGAVKVVVFFTDGMANMIENGLATSAGGSPQPCSVGGTSKQWIFGNVDANANNVLLFTTNLAIANQTFGNTCNTPGCCGGNNWTFLSTTDNKMHPVSDIATVVLEATNRCIQVAGQLRAASNFVFCVGLDVNTIGAKTLEVLHKVANDPASPTFDPTLPVGATMIAHGQDLTQAFQQIASDILLRLIQ